MKPKRDGPYLKHFHYMINCVTAQETAFDSTWQLINFMHTVNWIKAKMDMGICQKDINLTKERKQSKGYNPCGYTYIKGIAIQISS